MGKQKITDDSIKCQLQRGSILVKYIGHKPTVRINNALGQEIGAILMYEGRPLTFEVSKLDH